MMIEDKLQGKIVHVCTQAPHEDKIVHARTQASTVSCTQWGAFSGTQGCFKTYEWGAWKKMTQWLKALAALSEDLGSIPNNHMVAHNHL